MPEENLIDLLWQYLDEVPKILDASKELLDEVRLEVRALRSLMRELLMRWTPPEELKKPVRKRYWKMEEGRNR